jgi:hypothetical protein
MISGEETVVANVALTLSDACAPALIIIIVKKMFI